jgi:DNA-binding CsgD family transcriptional regulator
VAADATLARMRVDTESDWPERLASAIRAAPVVPEHQIDKWAKPWFRPGAPLSAGELMALRCAAHGMGHKETAALLGTTPGAVTMRWRVAQAKLRAKNTTHAVALAIWDGQL